MKKTIYRWIAFLLAALLCSACNDASVLKPTISGTPYEVLVVTEDSTWRNAGGKALFDVLNANMPGIPQAESMFKISRVAPQNFTSTVNIARNVVLLSVSEKYSKSKMSMRKDVWAKPQAVLQITAPTQEDVATLLGNHKETLYDYFVAAERDRQAAYYKKYYNTENSKKAAEMFNLQIKLPANLSKSKTGKDFFWASNMSTDVRQDIIIYTFPYTDKDTFTPEYLLRKRDSVLKANIPGPSEGSYMATERRLEPVFRAIRKNDRYCAEIRGWWRVEGDLMGGPFISHSQVDETTGQVLTVEGFVYAPGQGKRTFIRQLEAAVYAVKINQD